MGPPGGGRTVITGRLQSRFNLLNFTFPDDKETQYIFEQILNSHFHSFPDEDLRASLSAIVAATVGVYRQAVEQFLPTPQNSHYLFNMRDIAAVTQGLLRARKG